MNSFVLPTAFRSSTWIKRQRAVMGARKAAPLINKVRQISFVVHLDKRGISPGSQRL